MKIFKAIVFLILQVIKNELIYYRFLVINFAFTIGYTRNYLDVDEDKVE